tara:strand:+ start:449 stop:1138 length:690 start_codon:yes stop_codon:yes gene_type:complete
MSYSDWIQSSRSKRVWLEDSMTALAQFAFISPIHRVKHWDATNRKRLKCWAKESECVFCKRGLSKINEFTYGLYHSNSEYVGGGKTDVSYISATLATHTHFQKIFSRLIDEKVNPTDIVFELTRKKIKTSHGRVVNGYEINKTDMEMFVKEKFRPALYDSEEQEHRWVVPEEIVNFLKDKDGDPMSLIDLFLLLRDNFSGFEEKEIKTYAIKLISDNVLNLRNAREKWI